MPRTKQARANQLFTASSKKTDQLLTDLDRERQARSALTAKLREQRLAKEEAEVRASSKINKS